MSNGNDDPSDGTPKCNAAWDAYSKAEDEYLKARDECREAEFANETQYEWMTLTCDNFGVNSEPCKVELLAAIEAMHQLTAACDAASAADSARYAAASALLDCLSDHKSHVNVWLP